MIWQPSSWEDFIRFSMIRNRFLIFCFLLAVGVLRAHADAALLLEEPYGHFGALTPTGHAAIYLTRICAETPTVLRRCQPGELGAVISRYHRIHGRDWVAIPLIPYLYAVEDADHIPESVDARTVALLRNAYREKYLRELAPDQAGREIPDGEWTQLIGSAYDRKLYGFQIVTTPAQDDALIEHLNAGANISHFNILFHNCADFSRTVLNFYYPHLVHRNYIADIGITTPKQVARSLVKYKRHHHRVRFSAFIIPQVPGTLPRSHAADGVAESLLKSKKYVVPLAFLHPWFTAGVAVAYVSDGRFNPAKAARSLDAVTDTLPVSPNRSGTTLTSSSAQHTIETSSASPGQLP